MLEELIIFLDKGGDRGTAEKLAKTINAPITQDSKIAETAGGVLRFDKTGMSFECDGMVLHGDYKMLKHRVENGRLLHEPLVKAAKLKDFDTTPIAFDATAGMGEDSFVLAAAGFDVVLFERNPVIAALLKDTVRRAKGQGDLKEIAGRMTVVEGDSALEMPKQAKKPDIILLDPMFPDKNNTALVKKKFQMIYHFEKQSFDEDELIKTSMEMKPDKIIIKRPLKGPFLGGIKPGYSLEGKTVRLDIIKCR